MRRTTLAIAALLALTACGGTTPGEDSPTSDPSDSSAPSTSSEDPSNDPGEQPTDGSADAPAAVTETPNFLDWSDTGVPAGVRYVQGPTWEARADEGSTLVELSGGDQRLRIPAGSGRVISEVLMSADWAVVVRQDKAETQASEVDVVNLAVGGAPTPVTTPPAASGGSWALTDGDLYYPTYGDGGAYCLATYALADSNGEDGWCAPKNTGFSGLTASENGVGVMTFDDARPACRTVNLLDERGVPQPIDGPAQCIAWDVAATGDGAVWSQVPKPRRQEEAEFFAAADGAYFDLGPGTTGSLTPCGDSVFFVRDPGAADEPARLMRWTREHTLEVAYESPSTGNAFLGEPVCAGDVLTLSSFGEDGDEQVSAAVE